MKRRTFEEIIQEQFRWPAAGDIPFVESTAAGANATIAEGLHTRLVLMMDGYKKAADLMVEGALADDSQRDYLVCPIIFNYRQFIELSLKYMLSMYGSHVGISSNWHSHRLEALWTDYALMLERFGSEDPDEADPIVEEVVAQFAKIDPGSYSHRYPVDRDGRPLPLALTELHLPTLRDVMQGVANYFNGCDGFLDNIVGALP